MDDLAAWSPFIDPRGFDFSLPQLSFLAAVYGYMLFYASNLISDGSELLLFIPALEGIIGSVILPVLGVFPDAVMVVFSGLGKPGVVQREVTVGVGTLAGSTVMVLTLPWCLALFSGRVNILKDGTANYRRPRGRHAAGWQKLYPPGNVSLWGTGIRGGPELKTNAVLMIVTMMSYFIIQVPALFYNTPSLSYHEQERAESPWALAALISSISMFLLYLAYQYRENQKEESTVASEIEVHNVVELIRDGKFTLLDQIAQFQKETRSYDPGDGPEDALLDGALPRRAVVRMQSVLKHFFHRYDINHSNELGKREFYLVCQDMGIRESNDAQEKLFQDADIDNSGAISLDEFTSCIIDYARSRSGKDDQPPLPNQRSISEIHSMFHTINKEDEEDPEHQDNGENEETEDEGPPEDLQELPRAWRQFWIICRSFRMMLLGTALVLIFSDPMVGVLAEMGGKLNMSPFYVSFIISPLASNASELVAAYNYARKRTERTITVSISTLQGAACMNNTFCLGVFLGLIYFRGLAWTFSAECLAIILVELVMAAFSYLKRTMTLGDALFIVTLYPLSLALVYYLKGQGLD